MRPDEWEQVAETLLEGRAAFGGVSCLASSGDYDYPQPPFQAVYHPSEISATDPHRQAKLDAYEYWCALRESSSVDYSQVTELVDITSPSKEWACQGGACEWVAG